MRPLILSAPAFCLLALLGTGCDASGGDGSGDLVEWDGGSRGGCARTFLTSAVYQGDLGGGGGSPLERADSLCQAAALQAGMEKATFRAYVADGTTGAFNRLSFDGNYCATTSNGGVGPTLFKNKLAWKASPLSALQSDEQGRNLQNGATASLKRSGTCPSGNAYSLVIGAASFWSGSTATGEVNTESCSTWTSHDVDFCAQESRGNTGYFDPGSHLLTQEAPCDAYLHLLCFEVM